MSQQKKWTVSTKGKEYEVTFKPGLWFGKHVLKVDDKLINLKRPILQLFTGFDQPITVQTEDQTLLQR